MALRREITTRITSLLKQNPQGLSITEIVRESGINRNTAGRYLDNLLISGQVEMRHFGMAKIYSLSRRLPISSVLSISSEFVMQLDAGLRIVFLNQPFIDLLGISEKEIVGKNIEFSAFSLFFDETFPRVLGWLNEGLAGTEFRGELDVPSQDRIFSCRVSPTVFNNGQKGVSVIFEDITERKRGEALLRESEEKFRALVNNANDMITLHGFGPDGLPGQYREVNDEACRRLKYTREELLSMSPKDIIAPECTVLMSRYAQKLKKSGHATFDMIHLTRDGLRIPVEINAHLFEFHGEPVVLALVRDITERKHAEDRLRLLKISVDSAYDEVFWMDMKANISYVNDAACRTTGYSREELYAMKIFALDPDFTPERWKLSIEDLRRNKKQFFQTRHRRKDGVILDVEISSVYVTRGDEEYAFCFVRDITGRKRIEAALRESEARYRSLSEASQDMIFVIDREDRVLYINRKAAEFLKKPADAVIGQPRGRWFPPAISTRQYEALRQVFATGQPLRIEAPMKMGGETRWFDHALIPIPDAGGQVASVLGVSRDITKHINAEREFRENEQKYRFIAEYSVDIINRQTPECICTYTSPSITPVLGYTEQEVLGKSALALVHPDDLPGVLMTIEGLRSSGRETVTSVFRFRHKNGHYLWFESATKVIRDEEGEIREYLSISRDITERMTAPAGQAVPEKSPEGKKRRLRTG